MRVLCCFRIIAIGLGVAVIFFWTLRVSGAEAVVAAAAEPAALNSPKPKEEGELSPEAALKKREHERNQRTLQWVLDTFEGAAGVAKRSTTGAIELLRDALGDAIRPEPVWWANGDPVVNGAVCLSVTLSGRDTINWHLGRSICCRAQWT